MSAAEGTAAGAAAGVVAGAGVGPEPETDDDDLADDNDLSAVAAAASTETAEERAQREQERYVGMTKAEAQAYLVSLLSHRGLMSCNECTMPIKGNFNWTMPGAFSNDMAAMM